MSRDPERMTKMLAVLRAVWDQNPDWRLGQLISNAVLGRDPFYVEDAVMETMLRGLAARPATEGSARDGG